MIDTRELRIQKANELRAKGIEILKELGYTVVDRNDRDSCFNDTVYLRGTNELGYIIHVTACGYGAKGNMFEFSTCLMSDKYKRQVTTWNLNLSRVNINYSKPVSQIVNEVKRRFIPDHEIACIEMLKRIKDTEQYQDDKIRTVEILQGKPIDSKNKGDDRFRLWNKELGIKEYFHLEVRSKDSVRIEHDFTLEQALKVLDVLREYPRPESED